MLCLEAQTQELSLLLGVDSLMEVHSHKILAIVAINVRRQHLLIRASKTGRISAGVVGMFSAYDNSCGVEHGLADLLSHCGILLSVRALVPFDIISIAQITQDVNTFIEIFFIFFY